MISAPHELMETITDFGSPALLLPLTLLMAARLLWHRRPRLALAWLFTVAAATGLIALFKIWFSACGYAPGGVHSPSGHACFSALVYGGLALFAGAGASLRRRVALAIVAGLVVGLIAVSRVAVRAHTPGEALGGSLVGLIALAFFARVYVRAIPPPASLRLPLIGAGAVILPLHGHQLVIEPLLHRIGAWLHHAVPICVGA